MRKIAIRIAIVTLMFATWIIGIGSIYQIQMGQIDRSNMFPCVLMCIIGMGYFLLNIYRGQNQGADKMSLMEFGAMLEA